MRDRLKRLIDLRDRLKSAIEHCDSMRDLASLSRQYRETLKEIEEIEGIEEDGDDIAKLLTQRDVDGKSGAVR